MRNILLGSLAVALCVVEFPYVLGKTAALQEYPVPAGSHPHDVAPAPDGTVWYTAQATGELGRLDPTTGKTRHIQLGQGSRPHGVIVGPRRPVDYRRGTERDRASRSQDGRGARLSAAERP